MYTSMQICMLAWWESVIIHNNQFHFFCVCSIKQTQVIHHPLAPLNSRETLEAGKLMNLRTRGFNSHQFQRCSYFHIYQAFVSGSGKGMHVSPFAHTFIKCCIAVMVCHIMQSICRHLKIQCTHCLTTSDIPKIQAEQNFCTHYLPQILTDLI